MSTLWDTHCHLTGYRDAIAVLDEATQTGVDVVAVTEDPGAYRLLRARLGHRNGVTPALGMHPLRASTFAPSDLARFLRLLSQAAWVGEIGLDFSPSGRASRNAQLRVFEAILSDPRARSLPMTIHSRGAERETINRLLQTDARCPVLHWYTGSVTHVDNALAAGAYFSINPAMMVTAKGQTLLEALPADRVLLETDGPFARVGPRPARPSDLPRLVERLAVRWQRSAHDVVRQIHANQQELHRTV